MKQIAGLLVFLLTGAFLCFAAPVWVARYDGPAHDNDRAYALAVGADDAVYVTGASWGTDSYLDYATIKYDRNGKELWVARYDGPAHDDDNSFALAVDAAGNCYVTGRSMGSNGNYDFATISYTADGTERWRARYDGSGHGSDIARAVARGASNELYVLGESVGPGTGLDYALVKYDTAGNQKWVRRYNGAANRDDAAYGLFVDGFGDIYVTGSSTTSGTNADIVTVKYDANGNQLWTNRYDGPVGYRDVGKVVATDGFGNVYVGGVSWGTSNHDDYVVVKFDNTGHPLWVARYDGTHQGEDALTGMALTAPGTVFVTGVVQTAQGSNYTTICYEPGGTQSWLEAYNGTGSGDDVANAIALDSKQFVHVTGQSKNAANYDYLTLRYNSGGSRFWTERYDGPGKGDDIAGAIATGPGGNVYVTGRSMGDGTDYDYATVCYVGSGGLEEDGKPGSGKPRVVAQLTRQRAVLQFLCPSSTAVAVSVVNCLGQVVAHRALSVPTGASEHSLLLPVGVNFVRLVSADWSTTLKLVVF